LSTLAVQRSRTTNIAADRVRHVLALGHLLLAGAALLLLLHGTAQAQSRASVNGIYTCTDDRGIRRTSDRPIVECIDREQRVLNADGSVKRIVPPTLTPEERAEREAVERKMAEERAALNDAVRRDRNLKARFPNEATHQKAREAALEVVRSSMRTSQQRIKELEAERKPLSEEAEFFRGRALPARLKQQIEANETSVAAQRDLIQTQEAELVRVNRIYDNELEHLRKLWNGARPGSISLVSAPATDSR
jgi:hypothetical protein